MISRDIASGTLSETTTRRRINRLVTRRRQSPVSVRVPSRRVPSRRIASRRVASSRRRVVIARTVIHERLESVLDVHRGRRRLDRCHHLSRQRFVRPLTRRGIVFERDGAQAIIERHRRHPPRASSRASRARVSGRVRFDSIPVRFGSVRFGLSVRRRGVPRARRATGDGRARERGARASQTRVSRVAPVARRTRCRARGRRASNARRGRLKMTSRGDVERDRRRTSAATRRARARNDDGVEDFKARRARW